ncbi:MAG: hypothetical protein KF814_11430 [Nitrospiraceae bacterium]|nr:hypothetical protein [Nitrospiraceae bacterium]
MSAGFAVLLLIQLGGCGSDQSDQLLETARFEERQNNPAHAKELYEQILRDYPGSPAAVPARERLAALSPKP